VTPESLLTNTVCEPGTYSVNAPFVVVAVVVVTCANACVDQMQSPSAREAAPAFFIFISMYGIS
jgi:hypothetical protein